MKKIFFTILLLFLVSINTKAVPNPIMVYSAEVIMNELYFNDQGEWTMELLIWFPDFVPLSDTVIKQVTISSNLGQADLIHFSVTSPLTYLLITKDSLTSPLFINPEEDIISIVTTADSYEELGQYLGQWSFCNTFFQFGTSEPENSIQEIPTGNSVSLTDDHSYYYLDKSPTLGVPNDTVGGLGWIHGKMYDYLGNIFTSGHFKIRPNLPYYVQFNDDSTYSSLIPANNLICYCINYFTDTVNSRYIECDNFYPNLEPGMTSTIDIHLKDHSLVVGLKELASTEVKRILVAPNPFSTEVQIFVELNSPVRNSDLIIFDSFGKQLMQIKLPDETTYKISVPGEKLGKPGTYFYRIMQKKRLIASGKLLHI